MYTNTSINTRCCPVAALKFNATPLTTWALGPLILGSDTLRGLSYSVSHSNNHMGSGASLSDSGANDPWTCNAAQWQCFILIPRSPSCCYSLGPPTKRSSIPQLLAATSGHGAALAFSTSSTRVWFNGFNILYLRCGATTTLRKPRSYGSTPTESSLRRNLIQNPTPARCARTS